MRALKFPTALCLILAGCTTSPEKYRQKGADLFQAGQYEDAALNYRKSLQSDASNATTWVALARAELKQGRSVEAFQSLSRAKELTPTPAIRAELADLCLSAYLSDRRRPAALYNLIQAEIAELTKMNSPAGFRLRGQMLLAEKKPDEALESLLAAGRMQPGEPSILLPLAQALALLKRFDEAEQRLKPLVERDVKDAYGLLYLVYVATNRPHDAEAVLAQNTQRRPQDIQAFLELAHHLRTHGPARAQAVFDQLLTRRAEYPDLRQHLGDYWTKQNQPQEALAQYEAGETEATTPAAKTLLRKRRVLVLLSQKESTLAAAALEELLRTQPDDHDARHLLAVLHIDSGSLELLNQGKEELHQLATRHPKILAYQFSYGRALLAGHRFDEAEQQFTKALELDATHQPSRVELLEVRLRQRKYELALATADQLRRDDPGNFRYRHKRAQALISLGRLNEAHQEMTFLQQQDAGSPETTLHLGLLRYAEKRYAEAEALFGQLYESRHEVANLQRMALTRLARNQAAGAITLVEGALEKQPSPALRAFLASLYLQSGQPAAAEREYGALQAADPKSGEYAMRTGTALLTQGKWGPAIKALEQARALQPQNPSTLSYLATAYQLSGRPADAVPLYRESLRAYPEDPELLNALAFALADSAEAGRRQEGLQLAQKAVALRPGHLDYQDTLGYAHFKLGQLQDALPIFEALCRKPASRAGYALHLGMVQAALGHKGKAKQSLETALRAGPSPTEEELIHQLLQQVG